MGLIGDIASVLIGNSASKKAEKTEAEALKYAADIQEGQYQQTRSDQLPYISAGRGAIGEMARQVGVTPDVPSGGAAATGGYNFPQSGKASVYDVVQAYQQFRPGETPSQTVIDYYSDRERADQLYFDIVQPGLQQQEQQQAQTAATGAVAATQGASGGRYGAFEASPGYQFARDEGARKIVTAAGARGGRYGGGTQRAIARYTTGLAQQDYGNYWNRLAGVAGQGQTATQSVGNLGAAAATNIGQAGIYGGMSRASGIQQRGALWGNVAGGVVDAATDWFNRPNAYGG